MLARLLSIICTVYTRIISNQKDEVNFWVLIFFILTFSTSRFVVYFFPDLYLNVRHVHIHHYAYGVLILAVVGLLALNDLHKRFCRTYGALYGIGLGLAMDEFGMWIHLRDDYWLRHSYDAIFVTGAFLILIVYFDQFWIRLFKRIFRIQ
jgi:hypothetical protein